MRAGIKVELEALKVKHRRKEIGGPSWILVAHACNPRQRSGKSWL
jgi:hypothetical protein